MIEEKPLSKCQDRECWETLNDKINSKIGKRVLIGVAAFFLGVFGFWYQSYDKNMDAIKSSLLASDLKAEEARLYADAVNVKIERILVHIEGLNKDLTRFDRIQQEVLDELKTIAKNMSYP
jgi:hypothetical protein